MSKIRITTLLALASLLFLSACGENNTSITVVDKPINQLEYEQKTLEQAKALEEVLKKSSDRQLGSLL